MKIKVAITDDHPLIISGLKTLFSNHDIIELAGTYTNGQELLEGLKNTLPDILLLDIHLPDKTGDKLVTQILKKFPSLKIIALTNLSSSFYIYTLISEGASGYLLKDYDTEKIIEAIVAVYNGNTYISSELIDKMDNFSSKIKSKSKLLPSLTQKEKEVLKLTLKGYTLQEIAKKIFLGQRTVEYYRSNLFLKLDVKNMAELIKKAIENGLAE